MVGHGTKSRGSCCHVSLYDSPHSQAHKAGKRRQRWRKRKREAPALAFSSPTAVTQVAVAPSGPHGLSRRRIPASAAFAPPTPPARSPLDSDDLPFWQQNWF
ncbi:hypothetical protein OPV22_008649 [Ensete ventricosum]|uniref:Uncharacterized protein n=1 Tax=Ensete ventricosum TaxID=4639 RepID=A0AAV8RBL8_ENSVE|nr:hypothetical protein OPV22_008649 [Ensete ventricosum]